MKFYLIDKDTNEETPFTFNPIHQEHLPFPDVKPISPEELNIINALTDSVAILVPNNDLSDFFLQYFNDLYFSNFTYTQEQLNGISIKNLIDFEEDLNYFIDYFKLSYTENKQVIFYLKLYRDEGAYELIKSIVSKVNDKIYWVFEDVTLLKYPDITHGEIFKDNRPVVIIKDKKIVSANNAFLRETHMSLEDIENFNMEHMPTSLINERYKNRLIDLHNQIMVDHKFSAHDEVGIMVDSGIYWYDVDAYRMLYQNEPVAVFIYKNITKFKDIQSNFHFTQNQLDLTEDLVKSGHFIYDYGKDMYIWSNGFYDILERTPVMADEHRELIPGLIDKIEESNKNIANDGKKHTLLFDIDVNGKKKSILAYGKQLQGSYSSIGYIGYIQDITEQIKFEDEYKRKSDEALELQENLNSIIQFNEMAMSYYKKDESFNWTSDMLALVELEDEDYDGDFADFVLEEDKHIWKENLKKTSLDNPEAKFVQRIKTAKENIKHIETFVKLKYDNDSNLVGYVFFYHDITDFVENKNHLERLLKSNEILLQELHDKVKNNLQILSSLIDMDIRYKGNNPEKIVGSIQNRVNAMANVYEGIHRSNSLTHINLKTFIPRLIEGLLKYNKSNIVLDVTAEDAFVDADMANDIGFMFNEITNNAIYYSECEKIYLNIVSVKVSEKKIDNKMLESIYDISVIFRDDGIGLSDDVNLNDPQSLGFLLINVLANQINAGVEVINEEGLTYKITFKSKYTELMSND